LLGKQLKEVTLIKMPTYNIPNMTNGIDGTLVEIAAELPIFIPFLLLFVWGFIFMSGTATQKKRGGFGDMPLWATLSSIATLMVALTLSITAGMMTGTVLAIVVIVTILSGVWLFLDKSNREL